MKKIPAVIALTTLVALPLAACSDPDVATPSGSASASNSAPTFDVSTIETVDEIAALVPEEVRQRGVLRNGASTDYAPAEFRDTDGTTPIGYDVTIVEALAKVMGLESGTTQHAEFPTIIPALGSKFDIGMSSFTITPERLDQVNMVSYIEVGSSFAVKASNPSGFDPANPCGTTIGVQTGTYQADLAQQMSDNCVAQGKAEITIMPHDLNTDAITKLVGGQYDAVFSDSTVTGYAVSRTNGQIEQIGDVIESEPQGVAINKSDAQLSDAVLKAMQYLMDQGYLAQILAEYGAESAALTTAELNPSK